jgi:receptor expression-enhancing protein 5/6
MERNVGKTKWTAFSHSISPYIFGLLIHHSVLAAYVYPCYASFKALQTENDPEDDKQWLIYWVILGVFAVVEYWLDTFLSWFPLYYLIKLLFILWLYIPQTNGAAVLYKTKVKPFFKKHEKSLDNFGQTLAALAADRVKTLFQSAFQFALGHVGSAAAAAHTETRKEE